MIPAKIITDDGWADWKDRESAVDFFGRTDAFRPDHALRYREGSRSGTTGTAWAIGSFVNEGGIAHRGSLLEVALRGTFWHCFAGSPSPIALASIELAAGPETDRTDPAAGGTDPVVAAHGR
jgi:hypothetical protein